VVSSNGIIGTGGSGRRSGTGSRDERQELRLGLNLSRSFSMRTFCTGIGKHAYKDKNVNRSPCSIPTLFSPKQELTLPFFLLRPICHAALACPLVLRTDILG
jgi:hypothetical protein